MVDQPKDDPLTPFGKNECVQGRFGGRKNDKTDFGDFFCFPNIIINDIFVRFFSKLSCNCLVRGVLGHFGWLYFDQQFQAYPPSAWSNQILLIPGGFISGRGGLHNWLWIKVGYTVFFLSGRFAKQGGTLTTNIQNISATFNASHKTQIQKPCG